MLTSKIIQKKKIIDKFTTKVTDLIYSTFSFPKSDSGAGMSVVNEYENMRPDLIANRLYGDPSKWDALLKYNGVSNPFSVQQGDLLYAIPFASINSLYIAPTVINERGEKVEGNAKAIVSNKDKRRVESLANKKGASVGKGGKLPPNLAKEGDKSVKVKGGKLIFGEDVTTVNKDNCPVPISRARLQTALLKDKLFL